MLSDTNRIRVKDELRKRKVFMESILDKGSAFLVSEYRLNGFVGQDQACLILLWWRNLAEIGVLTLSRTDGLEMELHGIFA